MATAAATAPREALKQGRPHTIRYLNALNIHWRHQITPEGDEAAKVGHQAVNYLTALLLWADQNFLMSPLHRGQPLGLANDAQEEITGYSQRQCRRLRDVLARHGLVRVVPGVWGKRCPRLVICFENILAPMKQINKRPQPIPQVGEDAPSVQTALRSERTEEPLERTDRPYIQPTAAPGTYPRSFEEHDSASTDTPTDRSSLRSTPGSTSGPRPELTKTGTNAAASTVDQPADCSRVDPEDVELASPIVSTWLDSPKCPPRRRGSLTQSVRGVGDAQTVCLLASLRREGIPEELLVNAFQGCLDAYTPAVDRLRSPFIHSLVWFQPWIENAVEPWRREHAHHRARQERLAQRQVEREEAEAAHALSPVTNLAEFTERYGARRFLPPSEVLCEELDAFAPELAAHHREKGSSKKEIVKDVRIRCDSGGAGGEDQGVMQGEAPGADSATGDVL